MQVCACWVIGHTIVAFSHGTRITLALKTRARTPEWFCAQRVLRRRRTWCLCWVQLVVKIHNLRLSQWGFERAHPNARCATSVQNDATLERRWIRWSAECEAHVRAVRRAPTHAFRCCALSTRESSLVGWTQCICRTNMMSLMHLHAALCLRIKEYYAAAILTGKLRTHVSNLASWQQQRSAGWTVAQWRNTAQIEGPSITACRSLDSQYASSQQWTAAPSRTESRLDQSNQLNFSYKGYLGLLPFHSRFHWIKLCKAG